LLPPVSGGNKKERYQIFAGRFGMVEDSSSGGQVVAGGPLVLPQKEDKRNASSGRQESVKKSVFLRDIRGPFLQPPVSGGSKGGHIRSSREIWRKEDTKYERRESPC
jgi:hypothetical protein